MVTWKTDAVNGSAKIHSVDGAHEFQGRSRNTNPVNLPLLLQAFGGVKVINRLST
jgi:hypothetical protein